MSDPGFDIVRNLDVIGLLGDPTMNGVGEHPPDRPGLRVVPVREFAAVDEASAEPLLGDEENTVLSAGGAFAFYGDGGTGKTTLEVDLLLHLAAGVPWLGLAVSRAVRILLVENEGPRGKFRRKLRAKLAAWEGPPVEDRLLVLEEPWALFSFAEEAHREALRVLVDEHEIDLVAAGPVQVAGDAGRRHADEVGAFMLAIELTRKGLDRPLAVLLVHHENKQGDVSGAWQGRTDTLAHVQAQGNGATRLYWRKVRWGSTLHETVWKLLWRDGEGFELDDTPELTDDDVAASILTAVREHPGASMRTVAEHARGRGTRQREIRDELLESGALVNVGEGSRFVLYIAGDPALEQVRPEWDAPGTHSASATGSTAEKSERVPRPALRGTRGRGRTSGEPAEPHDEDLDWR